MGQKFQIKIKAMVRKDGNSKGVMLHKSSYVNTNANNENELWQYAMERIKLLINK